MEDWDAEIEGNATPNLDCLKINTDSNSLASKYFDDDYKDKDDSANGFRSTRGYGGPGRSRNHRGFGRLKKCFLFKLSLLSCTKINV